MIRLRSFGDIPRALALSALVPASLAAQDVVPAAARAAMPVDSVRLLAAERNALRDSLASARRAHAAADSARPVPAAPTLADGFALHGLLQGWYERHVTGTEAGFRIRRAELVLSGEPAPRVRWQIGMDAAKALQLAASDSAAPVRANQGSRMLQDAFVSVQLAPALAVDAGQVLLPLGLEGLQPAGGRPTAERALFLSDGARGGSYGDVRDVGVQLRARAGRQLSLVAGMFNGLGESQNDTDRDGRKSVAGRAVLQLGTRTALRLGASGAALVGPASDSLVGRRAGVDAQLVRGRATLQGELVAGRDGAVARRGGYLHAGFRVRPDVEVLARVDGWDPDVDADVAPSAARERALVAGATWTPPASPMRVQLNWVRHRYEGDALPARDALLVNLQVGW